MDSIAKKYIKSGLSCLPVKQDKSPDVSKWKDVIFKEKDFTNAKGIGIKCGKESHNLECLDFDNHFQDANKNLTNFIKAIKDLYEKYKFPINKTQSGGYHLLYRCPEIQGNQKLASKPKWQEERKRFVPDAIIETRGEGGYFVAPPTKGYETVKNDILNIYEITVDERQFIIETAKSFNQWAEKVETEFENKDRPGDQYNEDFQSVDEAKTLILSAGWVALGKGLMRRPGKDKGISGTFGKVAPNIFYCFTSNGYPFEPEKSYTPFAVYALLKHDGNFTEAAKELSERYKPKKKEQKKVFTEEKKICKVSEYANKSYIDISKDAERPPIVLSFREFAFKTIDQEVFTLGNFSAIIGKEKSKKSFLLSMLTGALINNNPLYNKIIPTLQEDKRSVLYFDTEQGYYHSHKMMRRIARISGIELPPHFAGFNLREYTPLERCEIIEYMIKENPELGFVVIDGIVDLANINDEAEGIRIAGLLMRLTKQYNIHISVVIHQNKMNEFATGHIGSVIMKKCETVISLKKDETNKDISHISCFASRAYGFEDFSFEINDDAMPVLCNIEDLGYDI